MSTSPSFPLNNDLADRPLSVYDNLTTNQIPNGGNKDYPKSTTISNGDPLKNISFKFNDREPTSNGGVSSYLVNGNKHDQQPASPLIASTHSTGISSPANPLINANGAPGINCINKTSQGFTAPAAAAAVNPAIHDPLVSKSSPRSVAIGGSSVIMSDAEQSDDRRSATGTGHAKPVISDAKSRFFGLTTSNPNSSDPSGSNDCRSESVLAPLLNESNSGERQVRINPPVQDPHTMEQRYQNIPPNSAIFRKFNDSDNNYLPSPANTPTPPAIVTTDLSMPDGTQSLSENPKLNSDDTRSERRRKTNSFHADMDLNYNQQPSQVIYMSTTVPQNIKSPNIAGRHTPTRNSLRHSRMLVVNKTYPGLETMNPLGLRHPRVARTLLIILLILGLIITAIGIWILLWAPYTRMQDNPYWSGLSLLLAATLGLIVIKFKRIKRQKIREHCFTFLKVDSMMLTAIACILCLAAFTCASLHLSHLYSPTRKCASTNIFIANASCICIFGARDSNFEPPNGTIPTNSTEDLYSGGYEFHYRDLSCSEVNGAWRYLLMASIVLNMLGFFVCSCYLLLACFKKKDKRKYNSVRTDVF